MRFLLIAILLSTGILSAQYSKGTFYFGQESGGELLTVTESLFGGAGLRARGGFFLRDRLLVGVGFEAGDFAGYEARNQFLVTPFARYYVPVRIPKQDIHLFGEVGLTTNFDAQAALSPSFALGAEYRLAPGAMFTASVRHTIGTQREPVFTTLRIGLNVLFGEEHSLDPALGYTNKKGDLLLNPSIGNATFGKINSVEYSFGVARLDGGIFLSDKLVLMGLLEYSTSSADIGTPLMERTISENQITLGAGLRYQLNNGQQWQPYVQGGIRHYRRQRKGNTFFIDGMAVNELNYPHLSLDVGAGIMYHLSTTVALDAGLSWRPILSSNYDFFSPGDQVAINLRMVVFPFRP